VDCGPCAARGENAPRSQGMHLPRKPHTYPFTHSSQGSEPPATPGNPQYGYGAISIGSPPGIQCASTGGGLSRRYHSASNAPIQPLPAAVTAWR